MLLHSMRGGNSDAVITLDPACQRRSLGSGARPMIRFMRTIFRYCFVIA
jgi:hypothetical protein